MISFNQVYIFATPVHHNDYQNPLTVLLLLLFIVIIFDTVVIIYFVYPLLTIPQLLSIIQVPPPLSIYDLGVVTKSGPVTSTKKTWT